MRILMQVAFLAVFWQCSFAFAPLLQTKATISNASKGRGQNLFQSVHSEATASEITGAAENLPEELLALPKHSSSGVNVILAETENLIRNMHKHSEQIGNRKSSVSNKNEGGFHDLIFANSYVDLGKVDTIGFDYDYTLVTYTSDLLDLIYDMALKRLVNDRQYPLEMLDAGLKFDKFFSIRGT
jgi:hypothetical protein